MGAALSALMVVTAAQAQTIEYTVTDIPRAPNAFNIVPLGINNSGVVVGWAQFTFSQSNPFFLRAWKWSAGEGLTLLPPPPGSSSNRYGARDISDTGIIVGDAGGDGGVAWRFSNGQYIIINPLPVNQFGSAAYGVNNAGGVVGTSGGVNITDPPFAYMFSDASGLVQLTPAFASQGRDINNAGQIAGWRNFPAEALRISLTGGVEFLGFPPGTDTTRAYALNQVGDVVGEAFFSPNVSRAFLFTDDAGIRTLPPATNSRNQATGINIHRVVVGNGTEGPIHGWVWTDQTGTRNLSDLVDPALGLNILMAFDINAGGQIIAIASDLDPISPTRILLLTPTGPPGDINGDGLVDMNDPPVFVAVLLGTDTDPNRFAASDLNGDGSTDALDIQPFVGVFIP